MKKLLLPLLILLAVMPSCTKKEKFDGFTRTVVYRQGDYNSKFYRIPTLIFGGISILCFIIMVTTVTIHNHLATAIVALAGMWASNGAYKYWEKQNN